MIGAFIEPGKLPPSTNDQRCTKRANMVLGSADVLLLLQRGYVDVGFMGGAQIDQYGNLNSSFIGDPAKPEDAAARAPAAATTSRACPDDRRDEAREAPLRGARRLRHQPGLHSRRHDTRRERGLPSGGMYRVVTDLAIFGFDERTRRMKVLALNPGVAASRCRTTPASTRIRGRPQHDRAADRTRSSRCCGSSIPSASTSPEIA